MDSFMKHASFVMLITAAMAITFILGSDSANARHAGAHPIHFVANHGVNEGACENPQKPCKTIQYALDQSGKGDKVHVGEGEYRVENSDIFYLLSDLVFLTGGYNSHDGFSKKPILMATNTQSTQEQKDNLQAPVTHIIGVPAEYREQLAAKGLHLIQDNKGEAIVDVKTAKELKTYKTLTTTAQIATACVSGMAGQFPCNDFDLQSHMPLANFSTTPNSANDIWGFVDLNDNNEYAIIGLQNGTAVVNITDPENPVEVGTIAGQNSIWRDAKVYQYFDAASQSYQAYAYVTTEANQGLQILDLTDLPNSISLANTVTNFITAHNIYIANVDYSTGLSNSPFEPHLYIAGANVGGGSFRVMSLADPINPVVEIATATGAGYMHDVTSVVITDSRTSQCAAGHNPCELLIDYNESTVDIWDITDATAPFKISSTGYANSAYTHSGWWSEDKRFIFIQDELDEQQFGINTTLRVLDINDLTQPQLVGSYVGPTAAIDHNGFVKGNRYYMSNYRRGLTVLDISTPATPQELGFFDTFPAPSANTANFNGAWGVYPFLPSGNIIVSDIEFGLFVISENPNGATVDIIPPPTITPPPPSSSGGGGSVWMLILLIVGYRKVRRP
jgi:choice-of-anchor B domain-containing protein